MRRFIRSMLAVEVSRRAARITRVQARWRGVLARRSLDARLLRSRLRLRWLTSVKLLLLHNAPAQRLAGMAGGRVHAMARGFLVRRRFSRFRTHNRAACLLQAAARGRRGRLALRLPMAQHRRWLNTEAALERERHARVTQENALRTLYQAVRQILGGGHLHATPSGPPPTVSAGPLPALSPVLQIQAGGGVPAPPTEPPPAVSAVSRPAVSRGSRFAVGPCGPPPAVAPNPPPAVSFGSRPEISCGPPPAISALSGQLRGEGNRAAGEAACAVAAEAGGAAENEAVGDRAGEVAGAVGGEVVGGMPSVAACNVAGEMNGAEGGEGGMVGSWESVAREVDGGAIVSAGITAGEGAGGVSGGVSATYRAAPPERGGAAGGWVAGGAAEAVSGAESVERGEVAAGCLAGGGSMSCDGSEH
jgi:hypothetical protein